MKKYQRYHRCRRRNLFLSTFLLLDRRCNEPTKRPINTAYFFISNIIFNANEQRLLLHFNFSISMKLNQCVNEFE